MTVMEDRVAAKYKLEEYDLKALREARQRIMVVYNYHYGAPRASGTIKRIETILAKIDRLIKESED